MAGGKDYSHTKNIIKRIDVNTSLVTQYQLLYGFQTESLTVQGELQVTYEEMGEYPTEICYYLQDIYRNEYWTETIAITFDSP